MRVVVIGAGLAGLTAAVDLAAAGVEVTVLEARDRVGGRLHGIEVAPGAWIDAGAAYLGDKHTELHAMIADLGLKSTPVTMLGASRFSLGGADAVRAGRFPPLSAVALGQMFDLIDDVTHAVDVDSPWLTPDAAMLDRLTVADWAAERLTHPDALRFLPLFLGEMMAADPADISVLHMGFYLRSGGGTRYLNAFEGGAQQDRVAGGSHQLCEQLAARLTDLRLSTPARGVRQSDAGVAVDTPYGEVTADIAVVALPPLLADALEFRPALPLRRATERTGRGCAVKVNLVYPTPIWRDHGLSGWSVNDEGPLMSTVDDSPPDSTVGVLTGFVTGHAAHEYAALSPERRREAAEAQATRLFPFLPAPLACHVTDWVNEEYSRGCYAALFGPGDWVRQGPHLTQPFGRVHWAGTETSTEFFGLMEGAIRSGHRVAQQITSSNLVGRSR